MPWSNVTKPTATPYTNTNPVGREQYDQADITYDDSAVFYDGVDESQWSDVARPGSTPWTNVNKAT